MKKLFTFALAAMTMLSTQVLQAETGNVLFAGGKDGKLYSIELDDAGLAKGTPVDMGVEIGLHPLTLQFVDSLLYVCDGGEKIGYQATGLGDGSIFVVDVNKATKEVMIDNFGGAYSRDPFWCDVVAAEGMIYFADRNDFIWKKPLTTRNAKLSEADFWCKNGRTHWYGNGIGWGHINGSFKKYGDTYWWAKNSNGKGVFKFQDSDVQAADVNGGTPPASGAVLQTRQVRSFVRDIANGHIYFCNNAVLDSTYAKAGPGIFRSKEDGTGISHVDPAWSDSEGALSENCFVTGMVIDEVNEYLYWAYRGPNLSAIPPKYTPLETMKHSGIKRIKLGLESPTVADVEYVVKDFAAYGLTLGSFKTVATEKTPLEHVVLYTTRTGIQLLNLENANVAVYSLNGSMVYQSAQSTNDLRIDLPKGQYVVKVTNDQNSRSLKAIIL